MTDPEGQEDREQLGEPAGDESDGKPATLDFPGADAAPPGRPDGDRHPDDDTAD